MEPGVWLPTRCVFCLEHRTRRTGSVPSLILGPEVATKNPATSTHPDGPVASEPGSPPGSRTDIRRPLPTAPPRGLRQKPAAPVQSAASRTRPFRAAPVPRVKDAAGDGQVPDRDRNLNTLHKNPPGEQNLGGVPAPCNEKHIWEVQATASHPCPKLQAGQPAC